MTEPPKYRAITGLTECGRGLGVLSLIVGTLTGLGVFAVTRYWIDASPAGPIAAAAVQSIVVFSAAWLLLSERNDFVRPILPAALIAAMLAGPTAFLATINGPHEAEIDRFPFIFWGAIGGPVAFLALLSLSKSILETGPSLRYSSIFFHGLTLPLIAGGATLFATLSVILLFAWGALLKQMDAAFFSRVVEEPWFIFPFFGAVGGISIATIRGQRATLGVLRFIILLFSRIAMPIIALSSLVFLEVLAVKGPNSVLSASTLFGRPGASILLVALASMLIFNGVYQNGESSPPPAWLRFSTIIAVVAFPFYAGLALLALLQRIDAMGLTPVRFYGVAAAGLSFIYSIGCFVAIFSEFNWKRANWLPFIAPFNRTMAAIWATILVLIVSPLANPWALSARSQEKLLSRGKISPEKFDFGYLQFKLGAPGKESISRLSDNDTSNGKSAVHAGIARARASLTYWEYQHPELTNVPVSGDEELTPRPARPTTGAPGPLDLPLNPLDAPDLERSEDPADVPN